MKKEVSDFVKALGGSVSYMGSKKILFITDPHPFDNDIEKKVIDKFGYGLPFKLATSDRMLRHKLKQ